MTAPRPGDLIAWWDGAGLGVGVVLASEKRRLRIAGPDGREVRIPEGRVAMCLDESAGGVPRDRALEAERRIAELAEGVEVAETWELALEVPGALDFTDLAELAAGDRSAIARAAVIRAFQADGIHFIRKGDAWLPRDAASVRKLTDERNITARRDSERAEAARVLAAVGRGQAPDPVPSNPALDRSLEALETLASRDLDTPDGDREIALDALRSAGVRGDTPAEAAFRLLRRLGRFRSDDENLQIVRYGLRTAFPETVTAHAEQVARDGFERAGREDLTALPAWTIDSRATREIDDAISWQPLPGGTMRIGVHVADPAAVIRPNDPVDVEAYERGITHYFPDARLTMLPGTLGERACSLVAGCDRPALSLFADVDASGEVVMTRIVRSVVRVERRLTYDEADGADALTAVLDTARALQARRARAGAIRIEIPEVDVGVAPDGTIALDRQESGSPSRTVVSEAMILAGAIAAGFCVDHDIPAIFRRQAAPKDPPPSGPDVITDPVEARAVRRGLRRAESSATPGPHHALGLPRYVQVTSPLRRYQDLVNHRQIVAALAADPLPYDHAAIQEIAVTTERTEIDARRAERVAKRYWMLRHLEATDPPVVAAIVVETGPRPVVVLDETRLEVAVPGVTGVPAGEPVRLRITHLNPRADVLRLQPAEGVD